MAKVQKTIVVNAPVKMVFGYISEPTNLTEIWPSLVEIKDVQPLPTGGHTNRWVYKMGGVRFEGTGEDIEHIPNQRLVSKTSGGVESTQIWMFEPEAGGTKVTFLVEYTMPMPLLGRLAEAVIAKMNDHEGGVVLANLKARLET